jgi:hypothetical protein
MRGKQNRGRVVSIYVMATTYFLKITSPMTYLSPVYTTLNFWYGTDKIGTRTTFLVLGLPAI